MPVLKAFEDGCDKVVLILTRPVDQKREQKKDVMPARLLAKAYPKAAEPEARQAAHRRAG